MANVKSNKVEVIESVNLCLSVEEAAAVYAALISFREDRRVAVAEAGGRKAPMRESHMHMLEVIATQMVTEIPHKAREHAWQYRPDSVLAPDPGE